MSRPIITCEGLSKYYQLGRHPGKNWYSVVPSLRDTISSQLQSARSFLRGKRQERRAVDHGFWALKDVSFEVERGEVVGILGRNGAGKSTLLKILSRIVEPTRGVARLRGRLASLLEVGTGFHGELSGRENIYLNGAILGMKKAEIDRKFDEIVAFSEIEEFLDTPAKRYSSGMYVRLAFAVAAHLEPEILIVDEVLAVGDFSFQKKCLGKMHDVAAGDGRTILFVSHNVGALSQLCTRGLLLESGAVTMVGSIEDVIKTYLATGRSQASGQSQFPVEPDRPIQWLSAELLHDDNSRGSEFSCDEAIKVCLKLVIRRPMHMVFVDFSIDTHDGIRILYGDCRDSDPSLVERLRVGVHTFEIRIPGRVLAPGSYTLSLAAHKQFHEASANDFDVRLSCVDFTIVDLSSMLQHRPGLLGIMLPWEHQWHNPVESVMGT
jgi:lipopolysaccharide transport system ATP-binding protein